MVQTAREHWRGKDNSSQRPCEGVEVQIMVSHAESSGGAGRSASPASLRSQERVWNNLPLCQCVSLFLSACSKSQLLRRHPGVRLVRDDGGITKHLKKMKGSVGECGNKSCFLFLKLSRIAHLTKQPAQLKGFTFHLPCLGQPPSATMKHRWLPSGQERGAADHGQC